VAARIQIVPATYFHRTFSRFLEQRLLILSANGLFRTLLHKRVMLWIADISGLFFALSGKRVGKNGA
jgi:hypothetical protein